MYRYIDREREREIDIHIQLYIYIYICYIPAINASAIRRVRSYALRRGD